MHSNFDWGNSVIKIVFKNQTLAGKYRKPIEEFLSELLKENESFTVDVQQSVENGLTNDIFCIDNFGNTEISSDVAPIYTSNLNGFLHNDAEVPEEKIETTKPVAMTCFNCLGEHHMKDCPEKRDGLRIAKNKEALLLDNSSRYHEEERRSIFRPGHCSEKLREAMELQERQLPRYVYVMRALGYPPGWMNHAVFESSGITLYNCHGKAESDVYSEISRNGTKYDQGKFVEYPGFNSSVPKKFIDETEILNMMPIQPHHQLKEMFKSHETINTQNMYKRRYDKTDEKTEENTDEGYGKKIKNELNDSPANCTVLKNGSTELPHSTPKAKLGESLLESPGTPIPCQGNPFFKLPDANKFADGITEHLPFENLPDAEGKYDNLKNVLNDVQRKLQFIRDES